MSELHQTANRASHEANASRVLQQQQLPLLSSLARRQLQNRHQKLIGTVPASLNGQRDD